LGFETLIVIGYVEVKAFCQKASMGDKHW